MNACRHLQDQQPAVQVLRLAVDVRAADQGLEAVVLPVLEVLRAVVESDKLPTAERAAAIDSFATFWTDAETLELVRAYYRIKDPAVRKRLFDMCKALANAGEDSDD